MIAFLVSSHTKISEVLFVRDNAKTHTKLRTTQAITNFGQTGFRRRRPSVLTWRRQIPTILMLCQKPSKTPLYQQLCCSGYKGDRETFTGQE